ncbi:MAG: 2-keto-4-pentenoate hydratase [Alphaproteobacteria bacterium]|nr:2-keto-4-pentenoate hydratase [Alphaproteobacteria bacterium]
MTGFKLLTYADERGVARPGLLVDGRVIDVNDSAESTLALIRDWDAAEPLLAARAEAAAAAGEGWNLAEVKLLAPLLYPPAIYCAGANYMDHAKEMAGGDPGIDKSQKQPYFFLKSQHCVVGPGDPIRLPRVSQKVDWEAEFAVVIGKAARNVPVEHAHEYVAGYTIMNDVSARDLGPRPDWPRFGVDWFGHKNFESAAPMGPWIVPASQVADHTALGIRLWVNQEKMQDSTISQLIFNVAEQIEYLSRRMTLHPGDVISTGTPSGVGRPRGIFLKPGDTVRVEIDGIGELANPVEQGE